MGAGQVPAQSNVEDKSIMRVFQTTVWAPIQGRAAEMVGHMATAKKIHERLGAKARAWQVAVAGPESLRAIYTLEFEDWNVYGKVTQTMNADVEWQTFLQTVLNSPDPSATLITNVLATGLPGLDTPPAPGSGPGPRVTTARFFEVTRGRAADARSLAADLKVQVERLGGRFRASQGVFAGPNTGRLVLLAEFDDIVAFTAFQAKSAEDEAFQGFVASRILAADGPISLVSASLRTEIPI
jgi:hypothetical protein